MFFRKFECSCGNPECRFTVYLHTKVDVCAYVTKATTTMVRFMLAMVLLPVKWIVSGTSTSNININISIKPFTSSSSIPITNLICRTKNYTQEELSISRHLVSNNSHPHPHSHSDQAAASDVKTPDKCSIAGPSHNRVLFASLATSSSGNVQVDVTPFFRHTAIDPRLTLRAGMLVRMITCSWSYNASLWRLALRRLLAPDRTTTTSSTKSTKSTTTTTTTDGGDAFVLTLVMGDLHTTELDKGMTKVHAWRA
jgi:hypothetical protein